VSGFFIGKFMSKRIHIIKAVSQIEPAYMQLKDLAAWSGVGLTRLREAVRSGDLPSFKYGGTFLVRLDEFNQWMEGHRYKPDLDQIVDEVLSDFK
jgi:excisionase family DNA binding protein